MRRSETGEDGFTLVELMVVLAIMALASAMLLPYVANRQPTDDLRTLAGGVEETFRKAQGRARLTGKPSRVVIDMKAREIRFGDETMGFPPGVTIVASSARTAGNATAAAYVFFPTGETTGGSVVLEKGAERQRIALNWLTGDVGVSSGP